MSWNKSVYSSMIANVGYDTDAGELLVTFQNGRTAAYAGVSEDTALELSTAPSVGSMFNEQIKGRSFRYV